MTADVKRYQDNLRDELNGAALYEGLAAAEPDPLRRDLFLQLAQAESSHAQVWRDKLATAGVQHERFVPGFRTRLLAKLARRFGPRFVLPAIAAAEFADRNKYAGQSAPHFPGAMAVSAGRGSCQTLCAGRRGAAREPIGRDLRRAQAVAAA